MIQSQKEQLEILHSKINEELRGEYKTNPVSYRKFKNANGRPYQAYERIGFEGLRWSVEKRIKEYALETYFKPGSRLLDIGSNYGFFVTEFALKVALAHGVEPVPELCNIGRHTADYLGVEDKTEFFAVAFEDFEAPCKYNTIFSLASFFTSDEKQRSSAESYFGKIHELLEQDGQFFYESTSFQRNVGDEDYEHYLHAQNALVVLRELFHVSDNYEAKSGPENYRLFVRCEKK